MSKMLEQLKKIILDNQTLPLKMGTPRLLKISTMPGKATICIGVRRCGKSTYMSQIMQNLLDQGVERENIAHIDFFDNRLHDLQYSDLELILEAYYSIYPNKKNSEKVYFFFDEIQAIENWESFINRLLRAEECEVYITGSSSKMLSKEIATQMRGRSLAWEMFPLSFYEFIQIQNIELSAMNTKQRLIISNCFTNYVVVGGFPEVAKSTEELRLKIHQEYFNTILFRDLIERHDISHPKALVDLAQYLTANIAAKHSLNSLYKYLKLLEHNISRDTIAQYLDWLEDAYFFFQLYIYDVSLKRTNVNDKKFYCIDHAMVTSVASGILVNTGHLLENLIFVALRRMTEKIFYYRTKSNKEVDFVTILDGQKSLVQVCASLQEAKTRQREIAALEDAMQELGLHESTIVTMNEEENVSGANGNIAIVPAWKFLLRQEIQLVGL